MDFYIGPSHNTTTPNGTRTAFTDTASKGFQRLPSSRSEKQQHSVTFQVTLTTCLPASMPDFFYSNHSEMH